MDLVPSNGMIDVSKLMNKLPIDISQRVHQEFSNLRPLGPSIIDANDVSKLSYNIASYHAHKNDNDGADDPEPASNSTTVCMTFCIVLLTFRAPTHFDVL